ncbi:MAG: universal stress protein, partial [Thermoanaerobaculia bacterium]
FTPRSRRAVRVAARMAASSGAATTLLHVIERIDTDAPGALAGFYRKLEKSARRQMAELLPEFSRRGLEARAEVLYGGRVNEILRFAEESGADLIVMSSHKLPLKRGGENWGTISYKVGILSRCPVMLVK